MPAHPAARRLIDAFGGPLCAPSANRSGHVSATAAAHVVADLGDAVAVVLDDGPSRVGVESTILQVEDGKAMLLRAGGLARQEIERIAGAPLGRPSAERSGGPVAPGQLASHYAPRAAMRLDATTVRPGEALLAFGPELPAGVGNAACIINLSPVGDLVEAAANLFAALRAIDGAAETIAVVPIPTEGLGEAIADRLRRAAAPR
jgi:L-threonylcarbamoyladenylate synthase